jgi:hypothetical protein
MATRSCRTHFFLSCERTTTSCCAAAIQDEPPVQRHGGLRRPDCQDQWVQGPVRWSAAAYRRILGQAERKMVRVRERCRLLQG